MATIPELKSELNDWTVVLQNFDIWQTVGVRVPVELANGSTRTVDVKFSVWEVKRAIEARVLELERQIRGELEAELGARGNG